MKSQKILLLNPYRNTDVHISPKHLKYYLDTAAYGDGVRYIAPLEPMYLKPILESAGHKVEWRDAHAQRLMAGDLSYTVGAEPCDIVVIGTAPYDMYQCSPGYVGHVNDVIKTVKQHRPQTKVIVYGTHASQDPLSFPGADVIMQGEPEKQILAAVDSPRSSILKPQFFAKELDELPEPDWSIHGDFSLYDGGEDTGFFSQPGPTASYTTNRGCYARCSFCNVFTMFPDMAFHKTERVVQDLQSLRKRGIRNVIMLDKVFTAHRPNAKKIMQALIDAKVGIEYEVMIRADAMDAELGELLYQSGCKHIVLGIESASESVLELMNKKIKWETVLNCMNVLRPYEQKGMKTDSFRVAFAPGETLATLKETRQRFNSMGWDDSPHVSTAFPDTPQWKWGVEEEKIIDRRDEGIPLDWTQTALTAGTVKTAWSRDEILHYTKNPAIRMRKILRYTRINGPVNLARKLLQKVRQGRSHFSM